MYAETILTCNSIFTGVNDKTFAGGVAIKGNKIICVGGRSAIKRHIGRDTKIYDFGERFMMAGFCDAHAHFFEGSFASSKYMSEELDQAHSEMECIEIAKKFYQENPKQKRIVATGWMLANWKEKRMPSCKSLDTAFPDIPVYLLGADGHTFWLNSAALKECGIDKNTTVGFGEIGKDENGNLNGLLLEMEACGIAWDHIYEPEDEIMREVQMDFSKKAAEYGITSMTDMSSKTMPDLDHRRYRTAWNLAEENKLYTRLHLYPSLGINGRFDIQNELRQRYDSAMVKVSGLKQFVDGVTTTYTGWLSEPYEDNAGTCGMPNYPATVYENVIIAANKNGFAVRLHVLGDRAVKLGLDIFEKARAISSEHQLQNCLEHCENINPEDIERFQELNVIASMQPYHLIADANEKIERIGKERAKYAWPHRSLLNSGATLAFGTDYPVVSLNPLLEIHAAVTRCDRMGNQIGVNDNERISVADALRSYTYGGACSNGRGHELGTLENGKLADIIVLDRNLLTIPQEEILNAQVVFTMLDGKPVFNKLEE